MQVPKYILKRQNARLKTDKWIKTLLITKWERNHLMQNKQTKRNKTNQKTTTKKKKKNMKDSALLEWVPSGFLRIEDCYLYACGMGRKEYACGLPFLQDFLLCWAYFAQASHICQNCLLCSNFPSLWMWQGPLLATICYVVYQLGKFL